MDFQNLLINWKLIIMIIQTLLNMIKKTIMKKLSITLSRAIVRVKAYKKVRKIRKIFRN